MYNGTVAWGDYNNDSNLDILLTGSSGLWGISKIYRNNGDNSFTEQTGIALTGASWSSVAWGDYDSDDYLDILLTSGFSKIYHNNGNNSFTEQTDINLTGVASTGSVAWGDYNNDGYQDIILTGYSSSGFIAKIYRNNGDNTFAEQTGITLERVIGGSVAWGDYDNDGNLDILLTGSASSGNISKIYHNNGDNTFTEQTSIALTCVSWSSVAWGDYNNDSNLDILLTGISNSGNISKIYRNNGDNSFSEQTDIALPGIWFGSAIMITMVIWIFY